MNGSVVLVLLAGIFFIVMVAITYAGGNYGLNNKLPRSKTTGYSPKGTPQGAGN